MQEYSHVLWDWNGTLLNDVAWCMNTVNTMLGRRGLPAIETLEVYRRVFCFPIVDYYRSVGFDFEKESYDDLAVEFVELYHCKEHGYSLFPEVKGVLAELKDKGVSQLILSASELGILKSQAKALGIDSYFEEILGISDYRAASKLDLALAYMKRAKPEKAILVGDSVHDKEVADAMGIDCVLIANGHQARDTLLSSGAAVVDSFYDLPFVDERR